MGKITDQDSVAVHFPMICAVLIAIAVSFIFGLVMKTPGVGTQKLLAKARAAEKVPPDALEIS